MTAACKSLGEVLLHWEAVQPDKPFLFAPEIGAALTYGQLAREARHFSTWLEQQNISEQGHVGLFMQNGRQTSTVFLATMSWALACAAAASWVFRASVDSSSAVRARFVLCKSCAGLTATV